MILALCEDIEHIKGFMMRPEIYRYAAEFGNKEQTFECSKKECWLDYDKGAGLINIEVKTGCMIEIHPYILRERKADYKKMIETLFYYVRKFMPEEVQKVNAVIPAIYENTCKIAESVGMTKEGVDRSSYRYNGGICDRILYGIKRSEING
jgi:hypothetical protein